MLNDKKVKKKVECFEDLFIWQKAVEFAKEIYLITEKKGLKNDFGLKNQMRDSAVSISSNIAKGSSGEIRSQLYIAFEVGYLEKSEFEHLREKAKFLSGSITNHVKSINIAEI